MNHPLLILIAGILGCWSIGRCSADEYADELPRIPSSSPAQSIEKMIVADGFEVQLTASEPLVTSPVAIQWDDQGRLFVCEMRGYSEDRNQGLSTIGLLFDDDQDGVFDRRTTFAEGLLWPTAIFPSQDGLYVGDAPNLYFLKDTNGDGVADEKRTVLTGFGVSNVQGLMNSMRWGLDNRIHLACSSVGGQIRSPDGKGVNVRGRDIAFDPLTDKFHVTSGAAQHGMCFDDWGRKFVSSNSDHIQQVMYQDHQVARNPFVGAPRARVSIASDGPQAEVFRASPVEPWRIVRTRLRVGGKARGPIEGGGRAAGYFTGATGVTIYRGDAWPDQWKGIALIGDVGSNLIHRKRLSGNGLQLVASRIDPDSEFVASRDIWFRPSQFENAPDGSLHVIDMCREVIEHPKSLPPEIKRHLDLTSGRDRGRLYRIVPKGFRHRPTPNMRALSSRDLVPYLAHPNAWHRETASRLLYERQDQSAVPGLRKLADDGTSELGRLHAMGSLAGLGNLDHEILLKRLSDTNPHVRSHAVRLATGIRNHEIETRLLTLAEDPSIRVRYELAFAMGEMENPHRVKSLATIIRQNPGDRWVQTAVQSSVLSDAAELFALLSTDAGFWSSGGAEFLAALVKQLVRQNDQADLRIILRAVAEAPEISNAMILGVVGELVTASRDPKSELAKLSKSSSFASIEARVKRCVQDAMSTAVNSHVETKSRIKSLESLRFAQNNQDMNSLLKLIDTHEPDEIQQATMRLLSRTSATGLTDRLLDRWETFSPQTRAVATEIMFSTQERQFDILKAVRDGKIKPALIDRTRLKIAASSKSNAVSTIAKQILSSAASETRAAVLKRYQKSLELPGDATRGKTAFAKHCSSCHRMEGVGHPIGPNLAAMRARGAEAILVNVIDPNREVNPQYLSYVLIREDGRSYSGMIDSEATSAVSLIRGEGKRDSILRSEIVELKSTGVSLMPEGLEETVDVQTMSDIIAYLMNTQ